MGVVRLYFQSAAPESLVAPEDTPEFEPVPEVNAAKKHAENIAYERSLIPEDARPIADFPKKSNFGKRALRRKRTSHYKNRLARKANFASVGYERTKEHKWADEGDEVAYIERKWRGQRSKHIKRTCNRLFRHSARLRMLVTGCKGILHKTTEFWWEYD